jgi:putative endonuclease
MVEQAYVYILASSFKRLYIGITTEIGVRIRQHKNGAFPDSFTSRYKIDRLVYLERYALVMQAIAREKQLSDGPESRRSSSSSRKTPNGKT